jgi:hypothetical protein
MTAYLKDSKKRGHRALFEERYADSEWAGI